MVTNEDDFVVLYSTKSVPVPLRKGLEFMHEVWNFFHTTNHATFDHLNEAERLVGVVKENGLNHQWRCSAIVRPMTPQTILITTYGTEVALLDRPSGNLKNSNINPVFSHDLQSGNKEAAYPEFS